MEERERIAKEYLLAITTSLKQTEKKRKELEAELAKWKERVKLAGQNGRSDLESQARAKVDDLETQMVNIQHEENELRREIQVSKGDVSQAKIDDSLSVNAQAAAAQLKEIAGEPDELSEALEKEEASSALEALKRQMQEEEGR